MFKHLFLALLTTLSLLGQGTPWLPPKYTPPGGTTSISVQGFINGQGVLPEAFGAKGDGVTDDTAALKAADAYAQSSSNLLLLQNNYKFTDNYTFIAPVNIVANSYITLSAGKTITWSNAFNAPLTYILRGLGTYVFSYPAPLTYPQWWGAKGDGTTDCTAAIQSAINANYRGTVYLNYGVYKITSTITITDSIQIIGCSRDFLNHSPYTFGCAIKNASTNTPAFTITTAYTVFNQGVTFRDFAINGNGSGTSTPNGNTDIGILFSGEAMHLFEHLTIINCGGWGIKVNGDNHTDKFVIKNCKISGCSGGGISAVENLAAGWQINCSTITECEISAWGDGILVWGNAGFYILNNFIQGSTGYGIHIETGDTTASVFKNLVIDNNYFEYNISGNIYGICNTSPNTRICENLQISKNVFVAQSGTTDIDLNLGTGSLTWQVWRGCRIFGNAHSGQTYIDLHSIHGAATVVTLPNWLTATFTDKFKGFSNDPTNPTKVIDGNQRTGAGKPSTSANYLSERQWDTSNLIYWEAISVGSGAADWKPCTTFPMAATTNTSAAPTGTSSATAVMMATGGTITPTYTGRVLVTISGQMANSTINDGATVDLRISAVAAQTAPVNGAAVSGTLLGIAQTHTSLVAADTTGFSITAIKTGLTVGSAYWIDASLMRVTGGTATITGVTVTAVEF